MHLKRKRIVLELLQKWETSSEVLGERKDARQSISDAMADLLKNIFQKSTILVHQNYSSYSNYSKHHCS